MNKETVTRKKRVDRNHIIYELVINGLNYIGVTAKTESTVLKSVRARAAKHFYRAKTEKKDWPASPCSQSWHDRSVWLHGRELTSVQCSLSWQ